jgi:hypothetical protein
LSTPLGHWFDSNRSSLRSSVGRARELFPFGATSLFYAVEANLERITDEKHSIGTQRAKSQMQRFKATIEYIGRRYNGWQSIRTKSERLQYESTNTPFNTQINSNSNGRGVVDCIEVSLILTTFT